MRLEATPILRFTVTRVVSWQARPS
jgi:hypothetical protein